MSMKECQLILKSTISVPNDVISLYVVITFWHV